MSDIVQMQVSQAEQKEILHQREVGLRSSLQRRLELEIARIQSLHDDNVDHYLLRDLFNSLPIEGVRDVSDRSLIYLTSQPGGGAS